MGKFDAAGQAGMDLIRRLTGRAPRGVPLDVADDVARAANSGGFELGPPLDGRYADELALRDGPDPAGWRGVERHLESDGFPEIFRDNWPIYDSVSGRRVTRGPRLQRELDGQLGMGPPVLDNIDVGPLDNAPDFELGSPLWHQLDKGARSYDNLRRGRTPNLRNQNPDLARVAGADIRASEAARATRRADDAARSQGMRDAAEEIAAAAATVGVVGGIGSMIPSGERPVSATTADLAAEARPVPEVSTAEEVLAPAPEKPDYAFQARELINKLNAMRRQAGGEVPEARAMTAEINRLLAMADKERNSPGYQPAMPTDYHGEAQRLIQQLNEMRRKAGGEVPQAPQIMAEVRRLQALGDRMRNAG